MNTADHAPMLAPTIAPSGATLLRAVFTFELRHQLRSPLFAAVATVFFVLAVLAMASESVQVGDSDASLKLNAHYALVVCRP